jgi:hypothetical protein
MPIALLRDTRLLELPAKKTDSLVFTSTWDSCRVRSRIQHDGKGMTLLITVTPTFIYRHRIPSREVLYGDAGTCFV